jgi:Putative restriction endonuclease
MPSAAVRRVPVEDRTIYPVKDDMGDPTLQTMISVVLLPLLKRWLVDQGTPTFVGMNQFFYWKQYDPSECVAPDVYVLPGVPLSPRVGAWKIWETGKVPSFALEVVSRDVDKDYLTSPPKYDRMGVTELVVFDPDFAASDERVQWQVFRRIKGRGLVKVEATNTDRVRLRVLGCFLRVVGAGGEMRLRIGTGPAGDTLLPTDEEARAQAEAEREQAKAEREQAKVEREQAKAEREQAKAERDEERAARERAEAELAELRATLAGRARRKGPAVKR